MCGIFGFKISANSTLKQQDRWQKVLKNLFLFSESRGKEASGLAIRTNSQIHIIKSNFPASKLLKTTEYTNIIGQPFSPDEDIVMMGHTRLVTNGAASFQENNQPVIRNGIVTIHNGIICNYEKLWEKLYSNKFEKKTDLDSEVIPAFLRNELNQNNNLEAAVRNFYQQLEGDASIASLFEDDNVFLLSTNTGSIYYMRSKIEDSFVFVSEKGILNNLLESNVTQKVFENSPIERLAPGKILIFPFSQKKDIGLPLKEKPLRETTHTIDLKRCKKCILPETFPGIVFDNEGICNICHDYQKFHEYGKDELARLCDRHRRKDGSPDCILAFSGGRDSTYALHYLKNELHMNPVTYTYDWGMVTDLARRNIARMCGKLGVENILVSANIPLKREYIKKNLLAWLKRPELGMITLLMAGDKEYFYYPNKIRKEMGIELVFFAGNRLEQTSFKSGFCGVKERGWYTYVSKLQKLKMLTYFIKQYLYNPRYLNSSLGDTIFAFYCAYVLKHNFISFYDYIPWDENTINQTLKQYNWETATDTDATWRIGDGTAAFYNYVYLTIAGFTEHDTFRSNQIRQGVITREEALTLLKKDNVVRYDAIKEYANIIGFDVNKALDIINSTQKIYA